MRMWRPGWGLGLASILENSVSVSECQCSELWGLDLSWDTLGNVPSSEWGYMTLQGVSAALGIVVFPPARLTCPEDHGDSSCGLLGNYSRFSAHSI